MVFKFDGVHSYNGHIDNEMFVYLYHEQSKTYLAMHKWVDKDRDLHFKTYKQFDTHFAAEQWLEDRSEL